MPTYTTTEGTKPQTHVTHEPRTIRRQDTDGTLFMMTEIGDGTFVQWSQCDKCKKTILNCSCVAGPTEPAYIKGWRTGRFDRELQWTRPEPERDVLESVMQYLRDRGWRVEMDEAAQVGQGESSAFSHPRGEPIKVEGIEGVDRPPKGNDMDEAWVAVEQGEIHEIQDLVKTVDDGLDKAAEAIKEARKLDDFEVDF